MHVEDLTCLFYCELDTIPHLLFHCCIARDIWNVVSVILEMDVDLDFEYIPFLKNF